jgi:pimeloyl-ACP methyl ester carboxylesterase
VPETKYARCPDGVHIAYQVFGEGDIDVVYVGGYISHIELIWEHEPTATFFETLGRFARVITFDRRGTGLSDRVADAPTLEQRMEDLLAVMDSAGSRRAALLGASEGSSTAILTAATHPDRVQALVIGGGLARATWAPDYPWGAHPEDLTAAMIELIGPHWGQGASIEIGAPSQVDNDAARTWYGRLERSAASPGMMLQLVEVFLEIDVRDVCAQVNVPTLVVHRTHDRLVNIGHGRWLAEHIPGARLFEVPGGDHMPYYEHPEIALGEVQEFLTGARAVPEPQRTLATVLFTDVVDSTRTAAEVGDARWRELLEAHTRVFRDELARHGGREVKALGDGFLATFDGPARAIRGARAIIDASQIPVRAGIHTGECEVIGDDIGGIAVHIAARVSARAEAQEVLVSRTVKDLVAGSGITFEDRGTHELKGVPDTWQLLAVSSAPG